jgi:hypothetical protein
MTHQAVSQLTQPTIRQPKGDARDLLSRLYREIGISAVAAALSVTVKEIETECATPAVSSSCVHVDNDMAA